MLPEARIVATGRGPASFSTVDEMADRIADPGQAFEERLWSPEVQLHGAIAAIWAPYDFYIDGSFSHCGIDAFHVVGDGESWRVQSLVYTVHQPPDCETHPEGPPGRSHP